MNKKRHELDILLFKTKTRPDIPNGTSGRFLKNIYLIKKFFVSK
jgi:hypothetical protein